MSRSYVADRTLPFRPFQTGETWPKRSATELSMYFESAMTFGLGLVFVIPGVLIALMYKRADRLDAEQATHPHDMWKHRRTWKTGKVRGQLVAFRFANASLILALVYSNFSIWFLHQLMGDTDVVYLLALCPPALITLGSFILYRNFKFTFEDAGRIGGIVEGTLTGPWKRLYGSELNVSLVCYQKNIGGDMNGGRLLTKSFETSLNVATSAPIRLRLEVPEGASPSIYWGLEQFHWYIVVSSKRLKLPVGFSIPIATK